jgi:diguanylate cyclase (GGDEF)-like protein/PAS domain S-box-containing protein
LPSALYIPVGLLIVGGLVLSGLAAFTWRRRSLDAGRELTVLLVAAMIWVLAAAAEHLSPTLDGKILASKLQYVGVLALPTASLVTVLVAIGRKNWVAPCLRVVVPLAVGCLAFVATNEVHGLIWSKVELETNAAFPLMSVEYGPIFWIVTFIGHGQLLVAGIMLLPRYWKNWQIEATLVYLGLAAPWIANALYVSRLSPLADLDITPFGLVVTGICFTISFQGAGSVFSTLKLAHRDVVDHIADLVLVLDDKGRLLSANRSARVVLSPPPLPASTATALAEHPRLLEYLAHAGADHEQDGVVELGDDGRVFDIRSVPISSRRSMKHGTVVVLRDVTQQRAVEDELRAHRQQLRQIVDLIPHPIFARDSDGRFLIANDACGKAYGLEGSDMNGQKLSDVHVSSTEVSRILANDRRVIESQMPLTTEEVFSNGTESSRTFRTTKIPFVLDESDPFAVVAMSIDVTEDMERSKLLHFLASTDPLTHLSNRRHFQDVLDKALTTAGRTHQRAALLFMDLDRFKMINDNYGHPTGDAVLRQVAERILGKVRFSDQVTTPDPETDGATVSRLGGDEFMILLPSIESPTDAAIVARRLMESLEAPFEVGSDRLQLGTSIGVAIYPEDGADPETLVRHCDQALTNAKRSQRGRVEFYSASISAAEERRHALELGLRRALERNEFTMHFQPIRDAHNARLVGAEALLRWTSEDLGEVTPDEFIPVAEDTGLVVPIGLIAVRSVCEKLAGWQARGLGLPQVSVNVSARQLVEPDSHHQINRILRETGVSGASLEFELTEGSILSENPMVEDTLSALQDLGATLALDDFGTGYSSLNHLRRFSFQRLKIDRSFVAGLGSQKGDEDLIRAVIALAQKLDIETVAEGVETEEQLVFLREEGCDFVQGYLLGRPVPAEEFERLLECEKEDR